MTRRIYRAEVFPDETTITNERCYIARHPDLEGCMAQGDTPEEALDNLEQTCAEWLLALKEDGLPIPEPKLPYSIAIWG